MQTTCAFFRWLSDGKSFKDTRNLRSRQVLFFQFLHRWTWSEDKQMMPVLSCSEGQCCRSATPHQFPQSKNSFNSWIIWSLRDEATLPWPRRWSHPPLTNVAFKYAGMLSARLLSAQLCCVSVQKSWVCLTSLQIFCTGANVSAGLPVLSVAHRQSDTVFRTRLVSSHYRPTHLRHNWGN